ncbi:MAG: aminotransferase class I/II-fold pyridoxal phosphate-dependent enzyme [Defluviitaleaceae bacterium]|nr:aminotransferase class I/II-fold pyridoxal phosphate-dependent enzyme [Defluviitaleaceae bacterium]
MQAIILAAGMGKRLKDLTENHTKCMVKINGVTLIERMLCQLDKLGLSKIIIVIGYKGYELKSFISTLDITTPIIYVNNSNYEKTNNIYSLYLTKEYLAAEDTLLLESDLIFESKLLDVLLNDPSANVAVVSKFESWMDGSVVVLNKDNSIQNFLTKNDFDFVNTKQYYKTVNVYKFSKAFLEKTYIPFLVAYSTSKGNNSYYEQVLKIVLMLDKYDLSVKIIEDISWYEIDDVQDLDIAQSLFANTPEERMRRISCRYGGFWRYPQMLDFCYLVNPYFPPENLIAEMKSNFETLLTQYPSALYVNNLLLAKFFGIKANYVLAGNGAAELIKGLLEYISGNIGITLPTFEEYPNRKPDEIIAFTPNNKSFYYNAKDLMQFFDNKTIAALVLINPDNPSGNYLTQAEVLELATWTNDKNIMFIVDESFVDFACQDDTLLNNKLLESYPNMVVIKSISKSYGVPGIRLGVLACSNAAIIEGVRTKLSIWNINSFAEFYLQIAEKYKADFSQALEKFYPVRDTLYKDLGKISYLSPIESKANYITCKLENNVTSKKLAEFLLLEHNILIKSLKGKRGVSDDYIRVAVRTKEDNDRLIDALDGFKRCLI